jgi:predicted permease
MAFATPSIEIVVQDVRQAFRAMRAKPGFAAAACCTLALGIGATTAVFSVVYAGLIRPLPYAEPDRLVAISTHIPQIQHIAPSLPLRVIDYTEIRRAATTFVDLAAFAPMEFDLTGSGEPQRLHGVRVSANLFPLLGVTPQLGRTFAPEEDGEGRNRVVVISDGLWQRQFGRDPQVIGRVIQLNGQPHDVVGVMPPGVFFPTGTQFHPLLVLGPRTDVWRPAGFSPSELATQGSWNWGVIGRLKSGAAPTAAQTDVARIYASMVERVRAQPGQSDFDMRAAVVPLQEVFSGKVRPTLLAVLAAVTLLLAIACVNMSNLLLVRTSSRQRELATRIALGARRTRLVRQLLTESLGIAIVGTVAGLLLAGSLLSMLSSLAPPELLAVHSARINLPVLLFAIGAMVVTTVAFGVAPAFHGARDVHPSTDIVHAAMTPGRAANRFRFLLVGAQIALCTTLLAVTVLLVQSMVKLNAVRPGFSVEDVLTVGLSLPPRSYPMPKALAFYRDLIGRVEGVPGVTAAAIVSAPPLKKAADTTQAFYDTDTQAQLDRPIVIYRSASPGYLRTMDIPLLAGRFLADAEPMPVVVIGSALAATMWPDESLGSVVGRRIRLGSVRSPPMTIVGVVGDVHTSALDAAPTAIVYRPPAHVLPPRMTLVIRSAEDPANVVAVVRRHVADLDSSLPVTEVETMRQIVATSLMPRLFTTTVIGAFAVVALLLTVIGVYGVVSYTLERHTKDIALRMAVGAGANQVVGWALRVGLRPVAAGLVLGIVAAAGTAFAIRGFLFGVSPMQPRSLLGGALILLVAAAAACYVPAARATRIQPVVALRTD